MTKASAFPRAGAGRPDQVAPRRMAAECEAEGEAAAAALRLYDNDAELLVGLPDGPAEELERKAKPVTAARAKEVIEDLRRHAAPAHSPGPDGSRADAV
ncbi:hypothetical protein ACWCPO_30565 [Streptomyces albidoflavus]